VNRYSDYKDSGVDWIGDIPRDWTVAQPKYLLNRVTREVDDTDDVVTCFRDGTVTLRKNRREDGFTNSLKEIGYQQILSGDLVVHEMDGFAGAIGISDSKGKSTPVYTVIEPDGRTDLKYVVYLLREMSRSGKIESLARSIRERTTDFRWSMWSVINFCFPPLKQQILISQYLDKKTKQIDSLIEKTQRKIDLLKEQQTATINQYVTKGLDPAVKMKDSGIEWIGEIPEHWRVLPIKFLVDTPLTDGPHETPDFIESGVPFLSVESVVNNKLEFSSKRGYISDVAHEHYSKKCKPKRDDILLVKSGSTTGKSAIVETDDEFNIWSPLCLIRSNKSRISPYFLFQSIQSGYFRRSVEVNWSFGTQPNIGMGVIGNLRVVVPPLDEQMNLISKLKPIVLKFDDLTKHEFRRIELLKEYRQSLISNVVTGKVRVTEAML
jgi:type I restriction enzyme S subunit